jgi:hypothetical protein
VVVNGRELMSLSDACFEFLQAVENATDKLSNQAHYYGAPDYPIQYGPEVDALKRMAATVAEHPYDDMAVKRLVELATSVGPALDAPPDNAQFEAREAEVRRLVRIIQAELYGEDRESVEAVVKNAVEETPYNVAAAGRLKTMLSKLGKPAYDLAVKIISDVGSAAAKKLLGL